MTPGGKRKWGTTRSGRRTAPRAGAPGTATPEERDRRRQRRRGGGSYGKEAERLSPGQQALQLLGEGVAVGLAHGGRAAVLTPEERRVSMKLRMERAAG